MSTFTKTAQRHKQGDPLTPIELRILNEIYKGTSIPNMSVLFNLSNSNVRGKIFYIQVKLGVHSKYEIMARYIKLLEDKLMKCECTK